MKIAFDTNIIVRLVLFDDQVKLKVIEEMIETYGRKDILTCSVALVEAYHVLTKLYHITQDVVMDSFERILKIEQLAFEHESALRQAIIKARKGFDFKDAFIGEIDIAKNVKTITLDKGLKTNSNFQVL